MSTIPYDATYLAAIDGTIMGRICRDADNSWYWETADETTRSRDTFSTREEAEKELAGYTQRLKNLKGKK